VIDFKYNTYIMSIEEFLKDRRFIIQIFTDVGVKPEYLNYLNDIIDDLSKLPENMDLYEDDPTRTKGQILVQIAFMLDQKIISAMDAAAASAAAAAAETMASTRTAARAARAADKYDLGMDGGRRRNTFRRRMRKRRTRRG
jgi:hypothetical protein